MAARTHTGVRPTAAGAATRLPWWALPLSMIAFATLFVLIAGQGEARAMGGETGAGSVGGVLTRVQQIQHTLSH
ncbi:hypothetical protein AB0C52_22695 [Streptomyces sp. NPDC048717]|uniref:hypothetical protein n=1 Tax=Streptomyces sp. NPDC048717 TaxID=3154928 RepID=UPI00341AFF65